MIVWKFNQALYALQVNKLIRIQKIRSLEKEFKKQLGKGGNYFSGKPGFYLNIFRKTVIIRAFVKSMKKAPTIGTTRKARGARP